MLATIQRGSPPSFPLGRAVSLAPEGKKARPLTRHVRGRGRTRRHVLVSFSRHLSYFRNNPYATTLWVSAALPLKTGNFHKQKVIPISKVCVFISSKVLK